jgi:uncharacterized protein (TIGR00304 family)
MPLKRKVSILKRNEGKTLIIVWNIIVIMKVLSQLNKTLIFAIILGILGIILLGLSVASGEGSASIVLIIPVFSGSGIFSFVGVLCIMAALMIGFMGIAQKMAESEKSQPNEKKTPSDKKPLKGGGVVLIGPIPIVFGSSPKAAMILMVMAIIIMIVAMILIFMPALL